MMGIFKTVIFKTDSEICVDVTTRARAPIKRNTNYSKKL